MSFSDLIELKEYLRKYNSHSILKMGTNVCWDKFNNWRGKTSFEWLQHNIIRNISIRLILLASAGNHHRQAYITETDFNKLIEKYFGWDNHTISNSHLLDKEAYEIARNILEWENNENNNKYVANWKVKLSDFLVQNKLRSYAQGFFLQRLAVFQNAGFGYPIGRCLRTIKLIHIIQELHPDIIHSFSQATGLSKELYFQQFIIALGWFNRPQSKGFLDFSKTLGIDNDLIKEGITQENCEKFVEINSIPYNYDGLWKKVEATIQNTEEVYQVFLNNTLLNTPFVRLEHQKYCLPDPISLTESCWNQIYVHVLSQFKPNRNKREAILGKAFEIYLENILLPKIAANAFKKISEVKNSKKNNSEKLPNKRADFYIELSEVYIIIECKSCLMSANDSVYFDPQGLAKLYTRLHQAVEQISATIEALNLKNKPVIPLILSFYDALAASQVFEFLAKETNYCLELGLTISPIVRSLHEFEHWTSNRSLENWAKLTLLKNQEPRFVPPNSQEPMYSSLVLPDNKGHQYEHLTDVKIFNFIN